MSCVVMTGSSNRDKFSYFPGQKKKTRILCVPEKFKVVYKMCWDALISFPV